MGIRIILSALKVSNVGMPFLLRFFSTGILKKQANFYPLL